MAEYEANFTLGPQTEIGADFSMSVINTEHNLLSNRDLADQHPISAITGLQDALNTIPTDYVSDAELEAALLEKQDVLTAGANIQIEDNIISSTDTTYTAGTGISIVGNVISNTQTSAEWGNITGTLSAQTDLQNALNAKANVADIPTATSDLTNDSGFITSAALTPYATQNYVNTALSNKQDTLTQTQLDAVNSGANSTNIGQIATNTSDIADINALIPNQASSSNQLADKDFVNSSIATNTATFRGTFNSVAELEAYSGEKDNNDYAFVTGEDSLGNTYYDNYVYNGTAWAYRWRLNNSSFTAAQWTSINSGATSTNIGQITINANNIADLQSALDGKANDSNVVHKTGSETITGFKTFTNKARITSSTEGAILELESGASNTNFLLKRTGGATCVLESGDNIGLFGTQSNHSLQIRTNYQTRMTFTTSGDVTLAKAPSSNSNSNQVATTAWTISKIPTDNNQLTNGAGYITGITSSDVTTALGYTPYNSSNPSGYITSTALTGYATESYVTSAVSGKQDTLVSGTNIKTINNQSLLGSGNIDIQGGGGSSYTAGDGIDITNNVISVDGVSTSEVTLATVATSGSYNDLSNKPDLSAYQTTANLVTSVSSSSTNSQYPSAKLFYDTVGDIESTINTIRGV